MTHDPPTPPSRRNDNDHDEDEPVTHPLAFGEGLRQLRRQAGLTQEELAERAGLSWRTISDLERGIKHRPQQETFRLLANALALSATERARLDAIVRLPQTVSRRVLLPTSPAPLELLPVRLLPAPRAVPVPLTPLVGRQAEVDALAARDGQHVRALRRAGATAAFRAGVQVPIHGAFAAWLTNALAPARAALGPDASATAFAARISPVARRRHQREGLT